MINGIYARFIHVFINIKNFSWNIQNTKKEFYFPISLQKKEST